MSDPWVLLTGPKGPTGTHLDAPRAAFRRFARNGTSPRDGDTSGFFLFPGYANFTPGASAQGHCRLQAYRSPQGRVTYHGLVYSINASVNDVFALPWDMLPNPYIDRVAIIADVMNQRSRFDITIAPSGSMRYTWNQGPVSPRTAGNWNGVHFTIPTYMPSTWVDFGCQVDVRQGSSSTALVYTVAPGQMSGIHNGQAFTVTIPTLMTYTLAYSGGVVYPFFYYDAVAQQFGHREMTAPGSTLLVYMDPTVWMSLAEEGKVVLALAYPDGGVMYPVDRRFFMRGPSDDFRSVPR